MRLLILILSFWSALVWAGDFDVPVGKFQRVALDELAGNFPTKLECEYQFQEIRFDENWGPSVTLTIRHEDENKPFIQFSSQVTQEDSRYIFSYRQGFDAEMEPWEVNYLVTPYEKLRVKNTIILYENGVVDFSTSVGKKIFGNGRIVVPKISTELITLSMSSSAGEYTCESL